MRTPARIFLALCALALSSCSEPTNRVTFRADPEVVRGHLEALSAAETKGAGIGTPGEAAAAQYITSTFKAGGLETSAQAIPYMRISGVTSAMKLSGANWTKTPAPGTDYVAWSRRPERAVTVDAPVVFAGFGIVSPEFSWDDYKKADVKGKVVLVLDDVPRNGTHDEFGALGESYYGRRLYKFKEAARHGAAAVFIIHENTPTADAWDSIRETAAAEILTVDAPNLEMDTVTPVEGWITSDTATALLQSAGHDFEHLKELAHQTNFEPEPLPAKASLVVTGTLNRIRSDNVIGIVKGRDPEYVLISTRWNHLGAAAGESAARNRHDDSSGAAVMLEVASALAKLPPPQRTIVFVVTTAHEDGFTGLTYYAEHPLFPMAKTIAHIHFDSADLHGESKRLVTIGTVFSGLASLLKEVATRQGRVLHIERDPGLLYYFKLSAAAFAEQGVPDVEMTTDKEVVMPARMPLPPPGKWAFNADGAVRNADLMFEFVSAVANATNWPILRKPGTTGKALK